MWTGFHMWALSSILVKGTTARWTVPQVTCTMLYMSTVYMAVWQIVSGQPL